VFGRIAIAMLFGLPRPTVDVDCLTVIPLDESGRLESLAGIGSLLHTKHGVYVQHVGIVPVPESYEDRLTPIFPSSYLFLRLLGLDAYDLSLSKLERDSQGLVVQALKSLVQARHLSCCGKHQHPAA
jgi:hypothetical protein